MVGHLLFLDPIGLEGVFSFGDAAEKIEIKESGGEK